MQQTEGKKTFYKRSFQSILNNVYDLQKMEIIFCFCSELSRRQTVNEESDGGVEGQQKTRNVFQDQSPHRRIETGQRR